MRRKTLVAAAGILVCVGASGGGSVFAQPSQPPAKASRGLAHDACPPSGDMSFLCNIHHPEDLEVLPGGKWIVASETSFGHGAVGPGALVLINTQTRSVQRIGPVAPTAKARKPYAACPAPPRMLSPHGLAVRPGRRGRHLLYVVNHEREAIEIYAVRMGPSAPRFEWQGCVVVPQPVYLNAVAPMPDGGFVTTRMADADAQPMWTGMRSAQNTGSIYRWRPGGTPFEIPNSDGSANNGIAVGRDGTIFLSSWGMKSIVRFTPQGDGYKREDLPLGFYTDNMRWAPDGRLLVAGQRYDNLKAPRCTSGPCPVKWSVARVDPRTLKWDMLLESDDASYSGATTAVVLGDDLWLGSFIDERIAILKFKYR